MIPMMRMNIVKMMRYNEWTYVYNKYFFIAFVIDCFATILRQYGGWVVLVKNLHLPHFGIC